MARGKKEDKAVAEAPAAAAAKQPIKVALVGCGFLGSLFVVELLKRFFSYHEKLHLTLIDDDTIDERNPANHYYHPSDHKRLKAEALAILAVKYPAVTHEVIALRVGPDKLPEQIVNADVIVDAVDNLPTRHWLYGFGVRGTPVLHLGVSQQGTGAVEWTVGHYDTFSLSPLQLAGKNEEDVKKMTAVQTLPPCELVAFRGLGLMTALAAAKSLCIAYGMDPENHSDNVRQFVSWSTTNMGHTIRETKNVDV